MTVAIASTSAVTAERVVDDPATDDGFALGA